MTPDGQLDMQQLLSAAQQMQEQILAVQRELTDATVTGTAGGGLVTARVNGQGELVDLSIAPEAIDPADPAESAQNVADLVLAAVRDACHRAGDLQQEKIGPFANAFGGAMPGTAGLPGAGLPGLPGLGGLLGGADDAATPESGSPDASDD